MHTSAWVLCDNNEKSSRFLMPVFEGSQTARTRKQMFSQQQPITICWTDSITVDPLPMLILPTYLPPNATSLEIVTLTLVKEDGKLPQKSPQVSFVEVWGQDNNPAGTDFNLT